MDEVFNEAIDNYANQMSQVEPRALATLKDETQLTLVGAQMLCERQVGRFLKMIAQMIQAKRCLDIGTFTGYSALSMAEGLPPEGEVISIDKSDGLVDFRKRFVPLSPHAHKVTQITADANDLIPTLEGPFDLVFIDADKVSYRTYYELCLPLVRPGGILVLDDMLYGGEVLNPQSKQALALHELNNWLTDDTRVENVLLPVLHGLQVVRKCD